MARGLVSHAISGRLAGGTVPEGGACLSRTFAGTRARRIVANMKVQEMRKLVRLRSVDLDTTRRRLAACYDVSDLRRVAKRRIPRPVFDYVDGAADEELAAAANVAAFRSGGSCPGYLPT
jgi:hypothetical protein